MIVLMTCANEAYSGVKRMNIKTALENGVDRAIDYNFSDMDEQFATLNQHILMNRKGAGFYLWKPYFINKALNEIEEGDYLIYADAAILFNKSVKPLIACMKNNEVYFMPFVMAGNPEKCWTKQKVFEVLECTDDVYKETSQCYAGFMVMKKCPQTVELISTWLELCQRIELISDEVSEEEKMGELIAPKFDQSIYSVLIKKYGIKQFRDPSQWGRYIKNDGSFEKEVLERSKYSTIINVHRQGKCNSIWSIRLKQAVHDVGSWCKKQIKK